MDCLQGSVLTLIFSIPLAANLAKADESFPIETTFQCGANKYLVEAPYLGCDIESECKDSSGIYTYWLLKKDGGRLKLREVDIPRYKSFNGAELAHKGQRVYLGKEGLFLDKERKRLCKKLD